MESNKREVPEAKSLRWLANNFPEIENPKDDVDRMNNCIHFYAEAGAEKIEEQAKKLERLKEMEIELKKIKKDYLEMIQFYQEDQDRLSKETHEDEEHHEDEYSILDLLVAFTGFEA